MDSNSSPAMSSRGRPMKLKPHLLLSKQSGRKGESRKTDGEGGRKRRGSGEGEGDRPVKRRRVNAEGFYAKLNRGGVSLDESKNPTHPTPEGTWTAPTVVVEQNRSKGKPAPQRSPAQLREKRQRLVRLPDGRLYSLGSAEVAHIRKLALKCPPLPGGTKCNVSVVRLPDGKSYPKDSPLVLYLRKLALEGRKKEHVMQKKEEYRSKVMNKILTKSMNEQKQLLAKQKTSDTGTLEHGASHYRYINRVDQILLCIPPGVASPLDSLKQLPPPAPSVRLCAICGKNPKRYNSAKTGQPLCSIECYRIDVISSQSHLHAEESVQDTIEPQIAVTNETRDTRQAYSLEESPTVDLDLGSTCWKEGIALRDEEAPNEETSEEENDLPNIDPRFAQLGDLESENEIFAGALAMTESSVTFSSESQRIESDTVCEDIVCLQEDLNLSLGMDFDSEMEVAESSKSADVTDSLAFAEEVIVGDGSQQTETGKHDPRKTEESCRSPEMFSKSSRLNLSYDDEDGDSQADELKEQSESDYFNIDDLEDGKEEHMRSDDENSLGEGEDNESKSDDEHSLGEEDLSESDDENSHDGEQESKSDDDNSLGEEELGKSDNENSLGEEELSKADDENSDDEEQQPKSDDGNFLGKEDQSKSDDENSSGEEELGKSDNKNSLGEEELSKTDDENFDDEEQQPKSDGENSLGEENQPKSDDENSLGGLEQPKSEEISEGEEDWIAEDEVFASDEDAFVTSSEDETGGISTHCGQSKEHNTLEEIDSFAKDFDNTELGHEADASESEYSETEEGGDESSRIGLRGEDELRVEDSEEDENADAEAGYQEEEHEEELNNADLEHQEAYFHGGVEQGSCQPEAFETDIGRPNLGSSRTNILNEDSELSDASGSSSAEDQKGASSEEDSTTSHLVGERDVDVTSALTTSESCEAEGNTKMPYIAPMSTKLEMLKSFDTTDEDSADIEVQKYSSLCAEYREDSLSEAMSRSSEEEATDEDSGQSTKSEKE